MSDTIEFFKNNGTLIPNNNWQADNCCFNGDLNSVPAVAGVYAIVYQNQILKVGKAEGKNGLAGRLKAYFSKNNPNDPTAALFLREAFDQKQYDFYYVEVPPTIVNVMGIEVLSHCARGLEEQLATMAINENQPMTFSRQK